MSDHWKHFLTILSCESHSCWGGGGGSERKAEIIWGIFRIFQKNLLFPTLPPPPEKRPDLSEEDKELEEVTWVFKIIWARDFLIPLRGLKIYVHSGWHPKVPWWGVTESCITQFPSQDPSVLGQIGILSPWKYGETSKTLLWIKWIRILFSW
jgi:hypothetical protein